MQFRGSPLPCVSQVFEDPVPQIRKNRAAIGGSASRSTLFSPVPPFTSPCGNFTHSPAVGLFSASSFPVQYSTTYFVAYGFAHTIWIASISCGIAKLITTHCGFAESVSPVNFPLRYGLLFQ